MMRRYFIAILFSCVTSLLLTSCSKLDLYSESETPFHHGILKTITDTINDKPKEALKLLENIDELIINENFSRQEYHEYQILLSEAKYKSYHSQTNHNEVIDANDYFDSLMSLYPNNIEIAFLNSKAYYYKAVGLEESEKTIEAFESYIKSLEIIELINVRKKSISKYQYDDILHFKALIYTRIGDILYWHDVYKAAIECITKANELFFLEENLNALSRNNIILAVIFGLNYDHDKALLHLSIADSILNKQNVDISLKNDIERIKASVLYNIGYKENAFNSVLNQYKTLDDPKQIMEAAGVLGDMYYKKKDYDSAIYYYEKYFPDNKYSKINAASNIIEISIITGNNELITKYAPSLAEETNKEIMLASIKTELSSLYHQHCTKMNNNRLYDKILKHLLLLSIITVVIFIIGLNIIKLRRNKYNMVIDEKSNYINALQKKIEKASSENKHIKLQIKNLEDKILDIKNKNRVDYISFEQRIESMKSNNLYKKLYEISINNSIKTNVQYPELQLNEFEQKELIELFNTTFDNGFNNIISEHKGLKYYDLLYFCLYIIGLDEKHISAVTGKTYNAVWNRTRKIQEILGSDENIMNIIKGKLKY